MSTFVVAFGLDDRAATWRLESVPGGHSRRGAGWTVQQKGLVRWHKSFESAARRRASEQTRAHSRSRENHQHQPFWHSVLPVVCDFVGTLAVAMSDRVDGEGPTRRRRQRRPRALLRHERISIATALAECAHHSSWRQGTARAWEEVEYETHNVNERGDLSCERGD